MDKSYLDQFWHVVDQPWGDGTWIVAGNPDPHVGKFVCNTEDDSLCDYTDDYTDEDARNDARNRAYHIVEIHNLSVQATANRRRA